MNDHVLSIEIKAPRQKVWDEITKTGRIQRAMVNTVLESALTPGSKMRYYSPNHKRVFVVGEVVECIPPRKFVHTYMFTFRPEEPTLVTWELDEIPGGCRVTLTHGGFTTQTATHKGVVGGWKEILQLLKSEMETRDIPTGAKIKYALQGAFLFMLPKSTRTEEVDKTKW